MKQLYTTLFLACLALSGALVSYLVFLAFASAIADQHLLGAIYLAGAAFTSHKLVKLLRETYSS